MMKGRGSRDASVRLFVACQGARSTRSPRAIAVLPTLVAASGAFACGARSELFDDSWPSRGADDPGQSPRTEAGDARSEAEAAPASDAGSLDASGDVFSDAEMFNVDASWAAPCLAGGNVFFVDGEGNYPGISGVHTLTGAQGAWSSVVDGESSLQLTVDPANGGGQWAFSTASDLSAGIPIEVGTFESSGGRNLYAQVEVDGAGCDGLPTGPFTIAEISYPDVDETTLTSMLVWFELTCGDAGPLRGCVSYGR